MKKLLLITTSLFAAPRAGDKEVSFSLPSLYNTNTTSSSASFHGKVVLLNLWASWCSGCQEEMPLFVDLQKKYSKKKFEIVLVNIDSDAKNALEFLANADKKECLLPCMMEIKHSQRLISVQKCQHLSL